MFEGAGIVVFSPAHNESVLVPPSTSKPKKMKYLYRKEPGDACIDMKCIGIVWITRDTGEQMDQLLNSDPAKYLGNE